MNPLSRTVLEKPYLSRGSSLADFPSNGFIDPETSEEIDLPPKQRAAERSCRPGYAWWVIVRTVRNLLGFPVEDDASNGGGRSPRPRPFGTVLQRGEGLDLWELGDSRYSSDMVVLDADGVEKARPSSDPELLPRPGGVFAQPVSHQSVCPPVITCAASSDHLSASQERQPPFNTNPAPPYSAHHPSLLPACLPASCCRLFARSLAHSLACLGRGLARKGRPRARKVLLLRL